MMDEQTDGHMEAFTVSLPLFNSIEVELIPQGDCLVSLCPYAGP